MTWDAHAFNEIQKYPACNARTLIISSNNISKTISALRVGVLVHPEITVPDTSHTVIIFAPMSDVREILDTNVIWNPDSNTVQTQMTNFVSESIINHARHKNCHCAV
jgi:hypothetical protein